MPNQHAIDETSRRIHAQQQRYLGRLEDERARSAGQLDRSRRRLAGSTNEPEATLSRQDPAEPDHDLEGILRSIDLRTIDHGDR